MLTREQRDLLLLQRILRNFDALRNVANKVAVGLLVAAMEQRYGCENAAQLETRLVKIVEEQG